MISLSNIYLAVLLLLLSLAGSCQGICALSWHKLVQSFSHGSAIHSSIDDFWDWITTATRGLAQCHIDSCLLCKEWSCGNSFNFCSGNRECNDYIQLRVIEGAGLGVDGRTQFMSDYNVLNPFWKGLLPVMFNHFLFRVNIYSEWTMHSWVLLFKLALMITTSWNCWVVDNNNYQITVQMLSDDNELI